MDLMNLFFQFVDVVLHLDRYLAEWTLAYGAWIYLLAFIVVFAETGFVVTPFLPGDSLLFALGALTVLPEGGLNLGALSLLLFIAAFLGDNVNFATGRFVGDRWIPKLSPRWIKKEYLEETEMFFKKHGAWAVVLARFAPILRTYVPFVAGLGNMSARKFFIFNILGAAVWTQIFLWAGHWFGQVPKVQKNFSLIMVAIVAVSLAPVAYAFIKSRLSKRTVA